MSKHHPLRRGPRGLRSPRGALLTLALVGASALAAAAWSANDPPSPSLGPITYDPALQRSVAAYGDELAVVSIDELLQERLTEQLAEGKVLWGATVVLEVGTGRVLALAEHSEREPDLHVALVPVAPAASVFKIVSAGAVLRAGVLPSRRLCTRGGKRRLEPRHLIPDRSRDWRCQSFRTVLPWSSNVAMARLVDQFVERGELRREADRWGFDQPWSFALPVEPSRAVFEDIDAFSRAEAAAGFGEVWLSALHAAALTATVAQRGVWVPPRLIDATTGGPAPPADAPRRVLWPEHAEQLAKMLEDVVERGTARRWFAKTGPALDGVSVAGKTGTLMDYERHVDTTWFVGYAPAAEPRVAIATVIVNDWNLWWVKALEVARHAFEASFEERPWEKPPDALPDLFRPVGVHPISDPPHGEPW